jgi:succinate dehydrogenase / fumarate reductase, flavoprotein subunit
VHRTEQLLATAVLLIGTGGAGLRAAIELAEAGVDVLAVGKRPRTDAHTALAAGGINAALATVDPQDSWQQHAADTLKEGYLLADPRTVTTVAKGAAQAIDDLERYGMPFAREPDGRISQRFFGAHTYRRTAFAGDYTGLEIQRVLVHRAEELRVPILDTVYITKLLVRDNVIFGAYGFDLVDGTRYVIRADAVILAAGGHTRIWRRTSSRRDENTGDAFRLAVEAGAWIRDPELVQFHPSGLIEPEQAAGTLVSEAARGEGGILRNGLGERFMARYDPDRMELSTRDRVRSPPTPRSRRGAARPTAASGSTCLTFHARRSRDGSRASSRRSWSSRCSTSRRRRWRSRRPRTTRWAASGCARTTGRPASRASTQSARHPADFTAPIASAGTRSSSCSSTGGSPAGRPPPTLRSRWCSGDLPPP